MAKPVPSRGSDQFMVRFPKGMRDKIKAIADQNGRSMNSEIISMLESSVNGNLDLEDKEIIKNLIEREVGEQPEDYRFKAVSTFMENMKRTNIEIIKIIIKKIYVEKDENIFFKN